MTQTALFWPAMLLIATLFSVSAWAGTQGASAQAIKLNDLSKQLQVGDVVFIRIPHAPFTKVADSTLSWTNHVGIVSEIKDGNALVSESRVPVSGTTTLEKFVARSEDGRVAIKRLGQLLNETQKTQIKESVEKRNGIVYDTGFNLHSSRQFCSRYVREVVYEATGRELGRVETFDELLKRNPKADQAFWRRWYLGQIPWQRETVTPASELEDPQLYTVFEGKVSR